MVTNFAARCYRKQLLASKVSLLGVLVNGGNYSNYTHLQQLYASIDSGKTTVGDSNKGWNAQQRSLFWGRYWSVDRCYQPWLVAHLHRTLGLQEFDPIFIDDNSSRTWLYLDIIQFGIPCGILWDWLAAAAPHQLENAFLLSAFSHKTLYSELSRRVDEDKNTHTGYLFASMSMAMVFRMSLSGLSKDFAGEANEWKHMYATWDLESRLFLLNVLASLDRVESRDYMYAWGPDLFPEASGMLDVARATGVHPAKLVRQWYDQRETAAPESLTLEGLL